MLHKPELMEMVRIRDKQVKGGTRLINKCDLTDNDVLMEAEEETSEGESHGH